MSQSFYVRAIWDPEAEVWHSESNIRGLVIEAGTRAEVMSLARDFGPELLEENHGIRGAEHHRTDDDQIIFATRTGTDG